MSDNLVNRLRWAATLGDLTTTSARNLMEEAAARIAELEAALKKIVEKTMHAHPMSYESGYYRIAHDALEGGKDE